MHPDGLSGLELPKKAHPGAPLIDSARRPMLRSPDPVSGAMHTPTYPSPYAGARLAGRLDRLVGRWSRGLGYSVEEYSLGLAPTGRGGRPLAGRTAVTQ